MEDKKDDKIRRDSMLYMAPREDSYGKPEHFAQCQSCFMWMGEQRNRCYILGTELEVKANHTCGIYVNGKPEIERAGMEKRLVTEGEAGYMPNPPNCKRCYWFTDVGLCGLFVKLNTEFPQFFDMDPKVTGDACCDGWTPEDAEFTDEGFFAMMNKKVSFKDLFTK